MILPLDEFSQIIKATPLVSIDLIVENHGKFLLGKRTNAPAKHYWFVPGGRILKNERINTALKRIIKKELNLDAEKLAPSFLGAFEHFYQDSFVSENISTHYVVLAYSLMIEKGKLELPLDEHSDYQFLTKSEILNNICVHKHTQDYFRK